MKVSGREYLTPREIEEFKQEMTVAEKQADYGLQVKQLELEIARLETKWTQVWRLPLAIILLPVKFIMAFAIPISVITKKDLPDAYWRFMQG